MASRNSDEIIDKMTNEDVLRVLDFTERCVANLFGRSCGKRSMTLCKKALEKQIKKAPKKRIDHSTTTDLSKNETPITEYYCSNCNKRIYVSENFCTQCGQKIDWSNEDD